MKLAAEDVAELDQRKEDGKDKIQRRRLGFEEETRVGLGEEERERERRSHPYPSLFMERRQPLHDQRRRKRPRTRRRSNGRHAPPASSSPQGR
jgi:hypothetical protein